MTVFSRHERLILQRFAEALIPAGENVPSGGAGTVDRVEHFLSSAPKFTHVTIRSLLWTLESAAVPFRARPFSRLGLEARIDLLTQWQRGPVAPVRQTLRVLTAMVKSAHFDTAVIYEMIGAEYDLPQSMEERPRWLAQLNDGREIQEDMDLEADVVIVGTGAGGAPLAYELASRGHAVLLLEEGRYFRRHEFNGHFAEMTRKMYRDGGMTVAMGNINAPLWAGCTVGGTTTVNSGTCYRTPERTFESWRDQFGLSMFSSESMDGYFNRVEDVLGVKPASPKYTGSIAQIIGRGADRLGYVHAPLRRNAPDCDGQGVCCYGCPSGAKRSTDVSYVPMALERGASLFASTRVDKILVENGAARGIVAKTVGGATITVHAQMTVLACGTLMTPLLLQGNRLANSSGQVGKNLSIHPAGAALALYDEPVDMHKGIPQGYCIEQFASEGMMFEGASLRLELAAVSLNLPSRRFTEVIAQYRHLASFGYVIQDTSRGRVWRGPEGRPLMTYMLNKADARKLQRCVEILTEVYLAAGATAVFPNVHGFDEIRNTSDLKRLRETVLAPGAFDISAYHPLGTARMGTNPKTSVVAPDHQTYDVKDLYIVDGSVVPSSLGVNPQVTIMAMALRAADILDRRLSHASESSSQHSRSSVMSEARA